MGLVMLADRPSVIVRPNCAPDGYEIIAGSRRFHAARIVADERRAVTFTVTNLADVVGNRFAFGAPIATDSQQLTPLRPRTIRLAPPKV